MGALDIGFIGLGIMGTPMTGHLLKGGHRLAMHTRSAVPAPIAASSAKVCASGRKMAQAREIVIIMVPDTPDVGRVLFGEDGVAEGLTSGKVVMDMSSISSVETQRHAQQIETLGCDCIDAPVSGGDVGARNATLSIMCGARQAAFDRVRPVLEPLGKDIARVGAIGDGQTCKVANQIVVASTINAAAERLLFGARAGAGPTRVRQTPHGGLATSSIQDILGERMIQRTLRDHSGMVPALEKLSGLEIGQEV